MQDFVTIKVNPGHRIQYEDETGRIKHAGPDKGLIQMQRIKAEELHRLRAVTILTETKKSNARQPKGRSNAQKEVSVPEGTETSETTNEEA